MDLADITNYDEVLPSESDQHISTATPRALPPSTAITCSYPRGYEHAHTCDAVSMFEQAVTNNDAPYFTIESTLNRNIHIQSSSHGG